MRISQLLGWTTALAIALGAGTFPARGQEPDEEGNTDRDTSAASSKASSGQSKSGDDKKFRDFNDVVKGAQQIDGFFTLHRKDDHLYAEIKPNQLDQPFLMPIAIAQGMEMAGRPLNFGDEWVLAFRRIGDKVQLVRRNVHYKAHSGTPLEKAVKQNYSDSVLLALPILAINHSGGQSLVIDFADIFFSDFAQTGFGSLDRNRSTWHKVKGFPNNIELEVEATFGGGAGRFNGMSDGGVIDGRGRTVVIHYSLAKMPDSSYHARYADDRVGHFLNATKDFGSHDPDTNFVRMVNRWRLEKADHKAKLSPPKKQIVWYVEDTVPHEYRPAVEEGIREWNKAFEKIGFRDAIAVRWQDSGRDEFDPEDINYCTFRWITTNSTFAMSCLRSNPLTGEMIDGDVIFDASWIKAWKQEYAFLTGVVPTASRGREPERGVDALPLAVGQILSPIQAAKEGFGLPVPLPKARAGLLAESTRTGQPRAELVPSGWSELDLHLRRSQAAGRFNGCQLSYGMRPELGLAALALAADDKAASDDSEKKDEEEKKEEADREREKKEKEEKEKKEAEASKIPEELIAQLIKEVVMHEVGHSLGLRHNFKASTMLTAEQLNDTSITRVKGLSGSVMDYNPINIAPRGQKQGDYTTTTIGPYDYWAIEYAYKPIDGDEDADLKKIAARSPEPDLVYATDEDMFLNDDPLVNAYDLGSDTLRFGKDRIALATDLLKDLDTKVVKDGESYARVREAFSILLNQWGNAAYLVASHVGGQSVNRDHKGKGARDPIAPTPVAKQREALSFLVDQILSDRAFKFSPALLRRLAVEKWYDWGSDGMFSGSGVSYPVNERVLAYQKIALNQCLSADVLSRLENQVLLVNADTDSLRPSDVFRALTDGVWAELKKPREMSKEKPFALSTIRRNLQREHARKLGQIVLGNRRSPYDDIYGYVMFSSPGNYPADARSLARMHLKEINSRISHVLDQNEAPVDDTTRAHLEECRFRISKVLDANVESNEP